MLSGFGYFVFGCNVLISDGNLIYLLEEYQCSGHTRVHMVTALLESVNKLTAVNEVQRVTGFVQSELWRYECSTLKYGEMAKERIPE
jgi:hypothetical protein